MTKEQILQKHFTAEFGHDGHGEFMQYILNAMEEYTQQQVKNLNIPGLLSVLKSVCDHDVRNFKDRQECEKCGEVWIRQ